MNRTEIKRAFEEIFDQALVFHCFADYMRDYLVYVHLTVDRTSGMQPATLLYRFVHCLQAEVVTQVRDELLRSSLDDWLIDDEIGVDLDGFLWGVKWHCRYPGVELVDDSARASSWSARIGIDFHEATITTEAHSIRSSSRTSVSPE